MLILVEGRDGSGKSTLCEYLYRKGFNVIKIPRHENGAFFELCELSHLYICDRSFITDVVYRIFDGKPTELSLADITEILHKGKVRIIYCYTQDDYKNSMKRGEDNITKEEDSKTIASIYEDVLDMLRVTEGITTITYDWEHDDFIKVLDFISEINEI